MADVWTSPSGPVAGIVGLSEMQTQRTDNLTVVEKVLLDGDVSASGKVHRHKSGTYANRPAAGQAGRIYLATDLQVTFMDDGTDWYPIGHNPFKVDHWEEHFLRDHSLSFQSVVAGSGAVGMVDTVSGAVNLDTGTTSGSSARLNLRTHTTGHYAALAAGVPALLYLRFGFVNDLQQTCRIGLCSDAGLPPVDGIYIERIEAGGASNAKFVTRKAGVETSTDLASEFNSAVDVLIEINSTSEIKCYVDGTLKATHTTNLPTATLGIMAYLTNTAAASKIIQWQHAAWYGRTV